MPTEKFERLDTSRMALILSVALDEFARHRYHDASFNRIIKASQMAKGTMYYYFKSKEDLFLTLYKATAREFAPLLRLAHKPPADAAAFWTHSRELVEGLCAVLSQKPTIGLFVSNFLRPSSWAEKHPAAPSIAAIDSWLLTYLERAQELGALRTDLDTMRLKALSWGLWESSRAAGLGGEPLAPLEAPLLFDLWERLLKPAVMAPRESILGRRDLRDGSPTL